ncbi:hypothetical protein LguiB_000751 [Lonicera macranthoides]
MKGYLELGLCWFDSVLWCLKRVSTFPIFGRFAPDLKSINSFICFSLKMQEE